MTALSPRPNLFSDVSPMRDRISEQAVALSVQDLCHCYADGRPVLSHLDFTVYEGERVGVVGSNGVGKTTLFHSICGVLAPTAGRIELFERSVQPGQFYPEVGLVFQYPDDQLFSACVRDDIAFGPQNMGLPPEEVSRRVEQVLQVTGTEVLADRVPHHLSGGQKRMVAIAGILAMQPRLAIFDEPSANLDIRSRRRLIHFLNDMSLTLMLASHDLELVLEVCDRVIVLDSGRVVADGPARQVMANPEVMDRHGLECPHSLTHRHDCNTQLHLQNDSQNALH
ncbi:MAG: energy-coupling factor ABC transporter ATP-binding protein [Synechococcus sp.]